MDSPKTTDWRHYRIRPLNDRGAMALALPFYSPTLDFAFAQARGTWPWATGWECVGVAQETVRDDQGLVIRKPA